MELENLIWTVLGTAPLLLVYLLAFILGLVFIGRYKTPGLLAMLGGIVAGVFALGSLIAREIFWARLRDGDFNDPDSILMAVRGVSVCGSLFEAVGVGLIAFAVFAGRKAAPARERWQEEDDDLQRREARRRDDRDRERPNDRGRPS